MANARVHSRNLLASWISRAASLVVLFFLSPFILHSLGQVEFGLWSLLTVITGYMGVIDLGMRASTGRHLALYAAHDDQSAIDETIRCSLTFFSLMGIVVIVLGAVLGLGFPHLFRSVPDGFRHIAVWLLPFMGLNVWLAAIGSVFANVLFAHNQIYLIRGVDLLVLAIRTVATVVSLLLGYGIIGLAVVVVACQLLGLLANFYLAKRAYPKLRVLPLSTSPVRLRELLGYGLAACVSVVSIQVITKTDMVIAGAAVGVSSVAVYAVGYATVAYFHPFLTQVSSVLFPDLQANIARGEKAPASWLFRHAAHVQLAIGVPVYVGMIVFAEPFIRLWMGGPKFGDESVREAALIMQIIALSHLPLLFVGASVPVLNALGHVRMTATIGAAEALLNLTLSLVFVLVFGWGLLGIALGTLAARLVVGTLVAPYQACHKLGVNWSNYVFRIGGVCVVSSLLFGTACVVVQKFAVAESWSVFFLEVGAATLIWPTIAFAMIVPTELRQRLWLRLRFAE